jgi:hypothetical protein
MSTRTNNEMVGHFGYLQVDNGEWGVERSVEAQLIQFMALKDPGNAA